MMNDKIYFREDIKWWYLATNINPELAVKYDINLNMLGAREHGFEVLSNEHAMRYDRRFNFIIANRDKECLLKKFGKFFQDLK